MIALSVILVFRITYEFVQSMVLICLIVAVLVAFIICFLIIWSCPYCKKGLPIATGDYCPFCGKRIHYSDNDDANSNQQ